MYELQKNRKIFTSKFVGTGPSSYVKKRIHWAAVPQRFRNIALKVFSTIFGTSFFITFIYHRQMYVAANVVTLKTDPFWVIT